MSGGEERDGGGVGGSAALRRRSRCHAGELESASIPSLAASLRQSPSLSLLPLRRLLRNPAPRRL